MLKQKLKYLIKSLPDPISRLLIGVYRIPYKIKISISNKRKIANFLKRESLKLELGSSVKKSGWVTIDLKRGADLHLNLVKAFPFPDESITEIHSEHLLEHLTLEEIKFLLKECFRVLKIGGEISFGVPDFARACRVYLLDKDRFYKEKFWLSPSPNWCKSKLDELNFLIYADGYHKFMFDKENGIQRLREVGFKECRVRDYDPEKDDQKYNPRIKNGHEAIYFVAKKI